MQEADFDAVATAAQADPETQAALRNASFRAALQMGNARITVEADGGKVRFGPGDGPSDFEIRAPGHAWDEYRAGRSLSANSLLAMARQGHLSKDGRLKSEFEFGGDERKLWANFHALDAILQHMRKGR
jgi:hypothetical protein